MYEIADLILKFNRLKSERGGDLIPIEFTKLPFTPKRIFFIDNVPNDSVRGDHAHRKNHQIIICIKGSFVLHVELRNRVGITMRLDDSETSAIYAPPLSWLRLYEFEEGTVCAVLASDPYDEKDYIYDKEEYMSICSIQ